MSLKTLNDQQLLTNTKSLVSKERLVLTEVLRHLREIERRRLYSDLGYQSLFEYAIEELNYSEGQAGRRIQAMRLIKEIPAVEKKVASGSISLSNLSQAQSFFRESQKDKEKPALKPTEKLQIIEKLENRSARQGQKILVQLQPRLALPKEKVRALSELHSEVRFVMDDRLKKRLNEVRSLMGIKGTQMNLAELIGAMADLSAMELKARKFGRRRVYGEANALGARGLGVKELDGKELDRKELDRKESDRKDSGAKGLDGKELGGKELGGDGLTAKKDMTTGTNIDAIKESGHVDFGYQRECVRENLEGAVRGKLETSQSYDATKKVAQWCSSDQCNGEREHLIGASREKLKSGKLKASQIYDVEKEAARLDFSNQFKGVRENFERSVYGNLKTSENNNLQTPASLEPHSACISNINNKKPPTTRATSDLKAKIKNKDNNKNKRRPISKALQKKIWDRDGAACLKCGGTVNLNIDHILPVARGGGNDPENLRLLCYSCNQREGIRQFGLSKMRRN